ISSICPQPLKMEWISGKARLEIPWLGTINLFFDDLLSDKLFSDGSTVGNVHEDCLICLGILIAILISIPIILDVKDYFMGEKKQQS
ncbi:MAG: S26 family signal peptidase, partial [Thermoplasmatales archaeon]|nr:S26 family signal peptidase [Thermoplasmatales archaeon]